MQAPLYTIRKSLLEAFIQTVRDPDTRWSASGMRDVSTIVAGYISQLALSFCCWCNGYNRLWYDLRTGLSYTTDVFGHRTDFGPITTRCELDIEGDGSLFTNFVTDGFWSTPYGLNDVINVGQYTHLAPKTQLYVWDPYHGQHVVPTAASTVRFPSPDTMLWMDSDGTIYTASCAT